MDSGRLRPTRTDLLLIKTWSVHQEEMFTGAHERYIYDGGLRRGKLKRYLHHLAGNATDIQRQRRVDIWRRGLRNSTPCSTSGTTGAAPSAADHTEDRH